MNILFIHSMMFHRKTWDNAAKELANEDIRLFFVNQANAGDFLNHPEENDIEFVVAELGVGLPDYESVLNNAKKMIWRVGLSPDMPKEFNTFDADVLYLFRKYIEKPSKTNYVNGMKYLVSKTGKDMVFEEPIAVQTTGIYHPSAPFPFTEIETYRKWILKKIDVKEAVFIGILFYYSQLSEQNTEDVDAVIHALESKGFAPLCVFCDGYEKPADSIGNQPAWIGYFNASPKVDLILNFMAGRLLKTPDQAAYLEDLNVPVVQILRSHHHSPAQWREDPRGLPTISSIYSLAQPEIYGVISPVLVAGVKNTDEKKAPGSYRPFIPVKERIKALVDKVVRWIRLRRKANEDKRITFVLHNNPCKGQEATVGQAAGLDTFESLAKVLVQMKLAGYDVGSAPLTGKALLDDIMSRKAVSEFRWTTVDEIINKGGALYLMDGDEYTPWFETLPREAREKTKTDWGDFPGLGMTYKDNGVDVLVITGVQYGNIRIMAQPKRGCYGAKCNGEVCRILHDPHLSPPHQWLATYKYIRENSDAVVHFGTEGALEFLPGKQTAMSNSCFSEISIGDLPNLYVYVLDATGEGLIAKRRAQAVLTDHLGPVYRPASMDKSTDKAQDLLEQYVKADQLEEKGRKDALEKELLPLLYQLNMISDAELRETPADLVFKVRRRIELAAKSLMPQGRHILGEKPDLEETGGYIAMMLNNPPADAGGSFPDLKSFYEYGKESGGPSYERVARLLGRLAGEKEEGVFPDEIETAAVFCRRAAKKLDQTGNEIKNLLKGLSGRFIPPALSGSLNRSKLRVLPTGGNFYATDVTVLPTEAAWETGKIMADGLLNKFRKEENRFPENIGVSIWSTDAFKSDGELFSQILYLMGVAPVRNGSGETSGIVPIDLKDLVVEDETGDVVQRPRVDVTVQTSGIMRDMVPHFCELMDKAVLAVSRLDEPEEMNYIKKHTREQMEALKKDVEKGFSDAEMHRLATLRVFSSSPGAYGGGVGLAIDASAWEDEKDLAEVYVNWNCSAYGYDDGQPVPYGMKAANLLAARLAGIDVAYMKQSSAEYDLMDCGCYAVSQGGMAVAAKAAAAALGIGNNGGPKLYWGDALSPDDLDVRDVSEEIRRSSMVKLLNNTWIEYQKEIGYQGASDVSGRINTLFKWSATTGKVTDDLFDAVAEKYILNKENLEWLREVNPYALEEITRRLLEAAERKLWNADETLLAEIKNAALELEGDMEEVMGDVTEDFQGSKIDVLTAAQVETWKHEWTFNELITAKE